MTETIQDDLTADEESPLFSFRQEDKIIELATILRENGMSIREAEVIAADSLDRDTHGEKQNLGTLSSLLDVSPSTIRSHYQNSKESIVDSTVLSYMFKDTRPQRIIAKFSISSTRENIDTVQVTVGRSYTFDEDQPRQSDEEYVIYLSEYEETGWKQKEYRGENVRRVNGRTTVLDEINRVLKDYRSNRNPIRVIGELMYALNISEGTIDPANEYETRMDLVNPLCEPNGPPEEYDKAPMVFGNHSSIVFRFEDDE